MKAIELHYVGKLQFLNVPAGGACSHRCAETGQK
jgi:hypothetical protein